jgi:hypothetical protein
MPSAMLNQNQFYLEYLQPTLTYYRSITVTLLFQPNGTHITHTTSNNQQSETSSRILISHLHLLVYTIHTHAIQ